MTISEAREIRPSHSDVGNSIEVIDLVSPAIVGDHHQFMVSGQTHKDAESEDRVYRSSHVWQPMGLIAFKLFHEPDKSAGERVDDEIETYLSLNETDKDFELLDIGITQAFNEQRRYVASLFKHRKWLYHLDKEPVPGVIIDIDTRLPRAVEVA